MKFKLNAYTGIIFITLFLASTGLLYLMAINGVNLVLVLFVGWYFSYNYFLALMFKVHNHIRIKLVKQYMSNLGYTQALMSTIKQFSCNKIGSTKHNMVKPNLSTLNDFVKICFNDKFYKDNKLSAENGIEIERMAILALLYEDEEQYDAKHTGDKLKFINMYSEDYYFWKQLNKSKLIWS